MNKKIIFAIGAVILLILIFVFIKIGTKANSNSNGNLTSSNAQAKALILQAQGFETQGNLLEAKKFYQQLIEEFPGEKEIFSWQKKIDDLNIKIIFSSIITPKSILYEVKAGDSLEKISKQNKTTVELIMKSNGLTNERIILGQKLRVWTGKFNIYVDKSQNILILKSDEEVIKNYNVSTGLNNSTPVGTFKIIEKIVNPPWYRPDGKVIPAGTPENILGTRWLGINKEGYGIHGTTQPKSIGVQATAGCVRMLNNEVEELFSIVSQGTEVTIVD